LIYIDAVCVDAAALCVHSRNLCGINGSGAWWYDGDRVGIVGLHPWGWGYCCIFNLGHDDSQMTMGTTTCN
jgi:hypothetical protein